MEVMLVLFAVWLVVWAIPGAFAASIYYADQLARSRPRLLDWEDSRAMLVSSWTVGLISGPIGLVMMIGYTGLRYGLRSPFRVATHG